MNTQITGFEPTPAGELIPRHTTRSDLTKAGGMFAERAVTATAG